MHKCILIAMVGAMMFVWRRTLEGSIGAAKANLHNLGTVSKELIARESTDYRTDAKEAMAKATDYLGCRLQPLLIEREHSTWRDNRRNLKQFRAAPRSSRTTQEAELKSQEHVGWQAPAAHMLLTSQLLTSHAFYFCFA